MPGKIEYVTAGSCESVYNILGAEYQVGTLSSTTTSCGYFDGKNQLIITSGDEFYKHELLRTLNILYPHAPDLLLSGLTTLWGGTANKAAIYHLKKLYPYILKHPEMLDKIDDFYYYDDETNPSFIFEAIVVNYILKHEGKSGLLKLMNTLKTEVTIAEFLKDHYNIPNTRAFFLKEFDYYHTRPSLENDDLFKLGTNF